MTDDHITAVCHTKTNLRRCGLRWTISNFESFLMQREITMESCPFSVPASPDTLKWLLRLQLPRLHQMHGMIKNCITVSLHPTCLRGIDDLIPIHGDLNVYMVGTNDEKMFRKDIPFALYKDVMNVTAQFVSTDQLSTWKAELFPQDEVTIVCNLTYVTKSDIVNVTTFDSAHQEIPESRLTADLETLFDRGIFYDVTIFVKGTPFKAHKNILVARSSVFEAMFTTQMSEAQHNRIDITDIEPEVFEEMLRYVYTSKLPNLEKYAYELIPVADKYDLRGLKVMCGQILCESLSRDNCMEILLLADMYRADDMKARAIEFIRSQIQNSAKIFSSEMWDRLFSTHSHLLKDIFVS